MCGIFGIIRHSTDPLEQELSESVALLLKALAVTSADRGTDAAGIAVVSANGGITLYKDVLDSYTLVNMQAWKTVMEAMSAAPVFAVLGHTRHRTLGANTATNAHPFLFEQLGEEGVSPIVGMHNGTITNHTEYGPAEKFDVDSANFLYSLATADGLDAWPALLEEAVGNFAVVLASRDGAVIARNEGSPCYLMYSKAAKLTAFASTPHMLAVAASMSGIQFSKIVQVVAGKIILYTQGTRKPHVLAFQKAAAVKAAPVSSAALTSLLYTAPKFTHMCAECYKLVDNKALPHSTQYGKVCAECFYRFTAAPSTPKGLLTAGTPERKDYETVVS